VQVLLFAGCRVVAKARPGEFFFAGWRELSIHLSNGITNPGIKKFSEVYFYLVRKNSRAFNFQL
jgi:hypothetical protein